MTTSVWSPYLRLTPWVVFDLERVAWIVEQRAGELSDDERRAVRRASERMLAAVGDDSSSAVDQAVG